MSSRVRVAADAPERRGALVVGVGVVGLAAGAAVARGHGFVIVGLLGAGLYALLFVRSPALALLAYVTTRPAVDAFVLLDAGPLTVGQVWGAGLLLVLVAFLAVAPRQDRSHGIPLPVLGFLALYGAFSVRGDTSLALEFGLKLALWLLLIVAVERISQTAEGQSLCFRAGYLVAAGGAVLIGILAATNNYGSAFYESFGLAQETEQSPIALAFLALFGISFPLIALLQRWRTQLSLALVAVLTIEITISYVRAALVALVPIVLVYIFVGVRRRRPTALAFAAALVATAYMVQERLGERFADLTLLRSDDPSEAGSGRVAIWTSIWDSTTSSVESIALGAGAGASNELSDAATGYYVDAHNDVLEFFATGGIFLAAAYVAVLVWITRGVWHVYRDPRQSTRARSAAAVAFGAIAAFITTSMLVSISFYAALVGFAILIGLIRGMAATPGRTCFDANAVAGGARM